MASVAFHTDWLQEPAWSGQGATDQGEGCFSGAGRLYGGC